MNESQPLCRHFGDCGGCLRQDMAYTLQCQEKEKMLCTLLDGLWNRPIPVIPSPALWYYRNKIDPAFSLKRYPEPPPPDFERETVLGFKRRGKWFFPLELDECRIAPEGLESLLEQIKEWQCRTGLRAWDSRKREGYLRHLLIRDGKRTGERMLALLTTPGPFPDSDSFVETALAAFNATSIYHGEFSGRGDVATAEKLTLLYGREYIRESLLIADECAETYQDTASSPDAYIASDARHGRMVAFRISPLSFFQTNPLAAERLYGLIRHWVAERAPDFLLDLYGGAGGIALSCADCAREIISVENVCEASEDGRHNACANGIANVFFATDSVRQYLRHLVEGGGIPRNSAVIVDPPRSGMHPKAIQRLLALRPQHLLYVSCNPKRLREELPSFMEQYRLLTVEAVDMFPHTPHVEVVVSLVA